MDKLISISQLQLLGNAELHFSLTYITIVIVKIRVNVRAAGKGQVRAFFSNFEQNVRVSIWVKYELFFFQILSKMSVFHISVHLGSRNFCGKKTKANPIRRREYV